MPVNATAGPSSVKAATPSPWPALIPLGHHAGKPPIPLTRPVTLVGSRHNAHLHLLSRTISKAHALIIHSDARVYIRDLSSRTHVYINGEEVREAVLKDGDLIKVGSFTFKYQSATGMKQRPTPDTTPAGQLDVEGADFPLAIEQRVMLIGRRPTCDISLVEDSASTAHAVLFWMNGKRFVRDLGSRTGTHVNGQPVRQSEINFGDTIRIGDTVMRYQAAGAAHEVAEVDELEDLVGTAPLLLEDHDAHAADIARAADAAHNGRAGARPDEAAVRSRQARPVAPEEPSEVLDVAGEIPIDLDLDLDEPSQKGAGDTALIPHAKGPAAQGPAKSPLLAGEAIPVAGEDIFTGQQMLIGANLIKEKLSSSATGTGMQAAAKEAMEAARREIRRDVAPPEPAPIPLFDQASAEVAGPEAVEAEAPRPLSEDELLADLMPPLKRTAPEAPPARAPAAPVAEVPQETSTNRRGWFGLSRGREAKELPPTIAPAAEAPAEALPLEPIPLIVDEAPVEETHVESIPAVEAELDLSAYETEQPPAEPVVAEADGVETPMAEASVSGVIAEASPAADVTANEAIAGEPGIAEVALSGNWVSEPDPGSTAELSPPEIMPVAEPAATGTAEAEIFFGDETLDEITDGGGAKDPDELEFSAPPAPARVAQAVVPPAIILEAAPEKEPEPVAAPIAEAAVPAIPELVIAPVAEVVQPMAETVADLEAALEKEPAAAPPGETAAPAIPEPVIAPAAEIVEPMAELVAEPTAEAPVEVMEATEATNESALPLEPTTEPTAAEMASADVGLTDSSFGRQVEEFVGESSGPILDETAPAAQPAEEPVEAVADEAAPDIEPTMEVAPVVEEATHEEPQEQELTLDEPVIEASTSQITAVVIEEPIAEEPAAEAHDLHEEVPADELELIEEEAQPIAAESPQAEAVVEQPPVEEAAPMGSVIEEHAAAEMHETAVPVAEAASEEVIAEEEVEEVAAEAVEVDALPIEPEPVFEEIVEDELPPQVHAPEEFVGVEDAQVLEAEQLVIADPEPIAAPPVLEEPGDLEPLLEPIDLGIEEIDATSNVASMDVVVDAAIAETPVSPEAVNSTFEYAANEPAAADYAGTLEEPVVQQTVAEPVGEAPRFDEIPAPVAEAPPEQSVPPTPPQILIPGMSLFDSNEGMRGNFVTGMPLMLDELAPPPPTFGRVQVAFGDGERPRSTLDQGVHDDNEPGPFDNVKVDLDAPVAEAPAVDAEGEPITEVPARPVAKSLFQNKLRVPPPPRRPKAQAEAQVAAGDFAAPAEAPSGFGQAAQIFGGLSTPVQNIDVFSQGLSADLSNDPFFGNAVKSVPPKDPEKLKRKGRKPVAPTSVDPQVEELAGKLAEDLGAPPIDEHPRLPADAPPETSEVASNGNGAAAPDAPALRRAPLRRTMAAPRTPTLSQDAEAAEVGAMAAAGLAYRPPGFETASLPVRRKGNRIAVLLVVMVALMIASFAVIYAFMKQPHRFEGSITFQNVGKLTAAEQVALQASQQSLLVSEELRGAALASLRARRPAISPGFLSDRYEFAKNEVRRSWRTNADNVLDTLVYRYEGNDRADEGAARHKAVLDALVALDAEMISKAGEQRQNAAHIRATLEQKQKAVEEIRQRRMQAMAVRGRGPAEDQLKAAMADRDAAKEAWKTAAAAALTAEAELKRLEQAAGVNLDSPGAALTPATAGADPELDELQKKLEQGTNRLSTARNTAAEQAENARKALENALEQFQQSANVVQSLMKDNPELSAFVSNAQKLQETTQKLSGDLLERQQKSYDHLLEEKRWVDERLAARRKELWDNDREIKKIKDELAMRERGYEAAIGSGYDDEAKKIKKAMDQSLGLIEKRKMEIENDSTLVTLNELAARRQQEIAAGQKQLEADRKQADALTKEMEKDFDKNAATVEKLPESQRTMAQTMTSKMEALNNARKAYSEALEAKNTDANAGLKMLEESVRIAAGKVEDRKKAVASVNSQQMTVEERQQRQAALDQKRAAYEAARKAENDAGSTLLEKERVANRLTDEDAIARKAGLEVEKLTTDSEVVGKEVKQLEASLQQAEANATAKAFPSPPVLSKPIDLPDRRPLYAIGSMAGLVFVFSLLIAFTGTREPKYETYAIPSEDVDPLGGAGVLDPETLAFDRGSLPSHAEEPQQHEAVA